MSEVLNMCKLLSFKSAWCARVCMCASQPKELEVFTASLVLWESFRHGFC